MTLNRVNSSTHTLQSSENTSVTRGARYFADEEARKQGIRLLLDKPKEYTSARVVNIVKKFLNVNKAGHSGTLDPKATGLMIICTGKMTKTLNHLLDSDKEYEGIMIVGEKTKSFDSETEVYDKIDIEHLTSSDIIKNAEKFSGEISQVPPMYSAIKHKGKPLYKMARKGAEVERKPRTVTIKEFEITKIDLPAVEFRVSCSKGTYIRTLVNDFGESLSTGAYLKELRRTKIGEFDVKNSIPVDEFINMNRY
ncbi:MAG: tRNA pseudouridine(55) synthase TruB [Ignavibacteria bacterium]|nr:tRNA pseudouridine(55) synthase TruB [Ignavibacteria bacterium]